MFCRMMALVYQATLGVHYPGVGLIPFLFSLQEVPPRAVVNAVLQLGKIILSRSSSLVNMFIYAELFIITSYGRY